MRTRKLLPLFLLFSFFLSSLNAQELVREGVQWNIGAVYWSFPPFQETISVKLEGDTLIQGLLYKKVYESYDSLNTIWEATDEYLREDDEKRVFYKAGLAEDIPLYDFNLVVGDTFPGAMGTFSDCYFVVRAIDTLVLLNGDQRKRWTVENPGIFNEQFPKTSYWIEGMGSSTGVIRHISEGGYCTEHYPYFTLCYYEGGEVLYGTPASEQGCWLLTSAQDINGGSKEISVYPNPTQKEVYVESLLLDNTIENVRLYSATGQVLSDYQIKAQSGVIDLNTYQPGVYYLLIEDSAGMLASKRLVKLE